MNSRKISLYIAMSLDGYIALPDNDISFLSMVDQEGEDYGYAEFYSTTDTIIIGRRTYDKVITMGDTWWHAAKKTYVLTRSGGTPIHPSIEFYNGDVKSLIQKLRATEGKTIYCDGGGETVKMFLQERLFDEITVSIIPILLGRGIKLFPEGFPEQKLKLISSKGFEKGLVQVKYLVTE